MRNYPNELSFSRHLCEHLSRYGYFVQRIETRETGRGVPDLYVGASSGGYWIELKRIKADYKPRQWEIPWRPGQQRWMYRHYVITGIPCFTLIAFNDMLVCIPMTKMHSKNIIQPVDILKAWVRTEDVIL